MVLVWSDCTAEAAGLLIGGRTGAGRFQGSSRGRALGNDQEWTAMRLHVTVKSGMAQSWPPLLDRALGRHLRPMALDEWLQLPEEEQGDVDKSSMGA